MQHSPGDLVSYKGRHAIVTSTSSTLGWMDKIYITYSDGSSDWLWSEDDNIIPITTIKNTNFLLARHGDPQSR